MKYKGGEKYLDDEAKKSSTPMCSNAFLTYTTYGFGFQPEKLAKI